MRRSQARKPFQILMTPVEKDQLERLVWKVSEHEKMRLSVNQVVREAVAEMAERWGVPPVVIPE